MVRPGIPQIIDDVVTELVSGDIYTRNLNTGSLEIPSATRWTLYHPSRCRRMLVGSLEKLPAD
jgi:hypothetical protein